MEKRIVGVVKMSYSAEGKSSIEFVEKLSQFLKQLNHYKPDVKSLRVNYLDKSTELKLLLNIPQGIKRRFRNIKIPAYQNYIVYEIFDAVSLNKVNANWKLKGKNWVTTTSKLSGSDKYFVIMKGTVNQESLNELIRLYCPDDPKKTEELDLYWIDSAIKDMSILERIYDELTIDKVDTCVNVGLERQFTSSIPNEIKEFIRAKAQHDIHFGTTDRQSEFRSSYRYRMARRSLRDVSSRDIYKTSSEAVDPENFLLYISVDDPFRISGVTQLDTEHLYPEKIGVRVQTDLNYQRPVAQGDLIFKRIDFSEELKIKFQSLMS